MRKDWEVKEFRTIIEILTDYHSNGSYAILKQNVELKDSENFALMVRSTDFENDFNNSLRYISESSYNFLQKSKVFGGEIIISKIGNAGKVYLMPKLNRPCSLAMNLFLVRVNNKKALSEYVYYYLTSQGGESQISSRLKGTTTQTITKENVKNLIIPIPPLSEQQEIVEILDEALEGIATIKANTQRNLQNARELFQSYLQGIFSNPADDWEVKKLGEITEVQSGGTPLRSKKEYWDDGQIPWYSSGELNDLYTNPSERNITKLGLNNSTSKLFPKGSRKTVSQSMLFALES